MDKILHRIQSNCIMHNKIKRKLYQRQHRNTPLQEEIFITIKKHYIFIHVNSFSQNPKMSKTYPFTIFPKHYHRGYDKKRSPPKRPGSISISAATKDRVSFSIISVNIFFNKSVAKTILTTNWRIIIIRIKMPII